MKKSGLTFREALEEIRYGSTVARKTVGKQVFLSFAPDTNTMDVEPQSAYIATKTTTGTAPWVATFEDMESDDWYVINTDMM